MPHSGGYPHAKFEGNILLFKFEPHTKSGLTIPQCDLGLPRNARNQGAKRNIRHTEIT